VSYLIKNGEKILIVNISREIDNHHHLLKKEEGFRAYFDKHKIPDNIVKIDIRDTDLKSIENYLGNIFTEHKDIRIVFVTNSRVSKVAHFIDSSKKDVILIGYDFLKENIEYMDKEIIDFLVCQKPKQQGYRGLISLYQHLAFSSPVEKIYFMPIDILTKENSAFYRN
jgi:LacI family transcriptional regulator